MLGRDQPVSLQLLEIPDEKAQRALKGVMIYTERTDTKGKQKVQAN